LEQNFNGYIHLKAIPGASQELMKAAGQYADRLSVNVEMPTEQSLKLLAPDKNHRDVLNPMAYLKNEIIGHHQEKKSNAKAPTFAPAGQSTQMVIGATPESDLEILGMTDYFYRQMNLKRVYYSGYVPISEDNRLPVMGTPVPVIRENRLYQADWLLRFYGFQVQELLGGNQSNLELDIDPKLGWALRNLDQFPVDLNTADLDLIKRVPGIGVQGAQKIVAARRFTRLQPEHLQRMGIAYHRAKYFLALSTPFVRHKEYTASQLKQKILAFQTSKYTATFSNQLSLF
jgi:putative DNA modification/repair radical SAM protein